MAHIYQRHNPNAKLFGESSFWIDKYRERYLNHIPFQKLDALVGNPSRHFQKWLLHRTSDAYLDAMAPDIAAYAQLGSRSSRSLAITMTTSRAP